MLHRLSTQVFLISLAVAAVASILTGILVRNQTVSAFEEAAARDLATDSQIYNEVTGYPFFFEDWSDAQSSLEVLAFETGERIAITDLNGEVILADTDPGQGLPEEPAAVLVSDVFGSEIDTTAFEACLAAVAGGFVIDGFGFGPLTEVQEEELTGCIEANQVDPQANALLYLGYDTESVNRGDLNLAGLLLGGGGVLAVAALGAVVLARRISGPVEHLTVAAGQLRAGDLTQRVAVAGGGEIKNLGSSFNAMAARLEETEQARQRLVSDVAHELRNPIGVLQGHLEAAQDGVLPLDEATIDSLVSETRHLGQLVRDLQEISLAETSALQIRRQPTDLSALCADVVASHAPLHPGTSLRYEGSTVIASADPLRIRQVVENLAGNALTHTNGGGHVAVTVSQTPTSARIEVTDSGPGIATEDLPHVFDRFWRADSSRTRTTGGSGLGLSISKAIIDAHHGSLTVESEPGHGTTFIAELPVSDIAAQ